MISRLATRTATRYESADVTMMQMRCEEVEALRAENKRLREQIEALKKAMAKIVMSVGAM